MEFLILKMTATLENATMIIIAWVDPIRSEATREETAEPFSR